MSASIGYSQTGKTVALIDPNTLPEEEKVLQTGSNFEPFSSFESLCNRINVSAFIPRFKKENGEALKTLLPLYPLEHQIRCIQETLRRYEYTRALANVTPTGLGKTFFAMIIAYVLDLKLFVVGTAAADLAWVSQADIFGIAGKNGTYETINGSERIKNGVSVSKMETATSFRGASERMYFSLGNKFLNIIHYGTILRNYVNPETWEVSEVFKNLVDVGILVVFDEAHQIKNSDAAQTRAAMALSDYINFSVPQTRSRLMYMSATLVDTKKGAANMSRLLGIVPPPPLGVEDNLNYRTAGTINWINQNGGMLNLHDRNAPNFTPTFIDIFGAHIKPKFIDRMGKIEYPKYLQSYGSYLYLRIDRNTLINYVRTLDEIEWILRTEKSNETVKRRATKLTAINHSLEAFEFGLAPEIAKFIVRTAKECPYVKVVVAFFHHKAINRFVKTLNELGYGDAYVLMRGTKKKEKDGKTTYSTLPGKKRGQLIDQFISRNNSVHLDAQGILRRRYVVFILQQTTAESISLHDTFGDSPTIFISCFNYQYQKLVQAAGRVIRSGMLSPAFVFWAVPDMLLTEGIDPEYDDLSPVEKYHITTSLNYKSVSDRLASKSQTVKIISDIRNDEEEGDDEDTGVSRQDAAVQFHEYRISRLVGLSEDQSNYCRSAIIVLRRNQMVEIFNRQKEIGQYYFSLEVWNDFFTHFYNMGRNDYNNNWVQFFTQLYRTGMPDINMTIDPDANPEYSEIYQYQAHFFIRGIATPNDYAWALHFSSEMNKDKIIEALNEKEVPGEMSHTEAIF